MKKEKDLQIFNYLLEFLKLRRNFIQSMNIDIFDKDGNRYTSREWFIAPLEIIEQAIRLIISGEIVGYRYAGEKGEIGKR